jgi:hypothetical protein
MLVSNPLCWFYHGAAHLVRKLISLFDLRRSKESAWREWISKEHVLYIILRQRRNLQDCCGGKMFKVTEIYIFIVRAIRHFMIFVPT